MGWTSFSKSYCIFDKRGHVDKKATMTREIESYGDIKVVKAVMSGTNYYSVVHNLKSGDYFLLMCLTGVRDGEFWYKEMEDTMGPCYYDCPKSILDLADALCPCTEEYDRSGWAKEWREKCRKNLEKKKLPTTYAKVKVGAEIDWHVPEDSGLEAFGAPLAGRTIRLTKWSGKRSWITYDFGWAMRVPTKFVRPEDCEVVG